MSVLPGADPFAANGSPTGVLVLHGFTGSPVSMRPWAEHLAAAGMTVRLPLLPGHGTRWQDLNGTTWEDWYLAVERALDELSGRCKEVFVCGLSMGATLALRLAEVRPDDVSGVIVVNPSLNTEDRRAVLLPLFSRFLSSFPPIGNDIKKPGVDEGAYHRLPLRAAVSVPKLWAAVRADLAAIRAPILAFRSETDHVVPASSMLLLTSGATGTTVTERLLTGSYHVATLDHDAPAIFEQSVEFIRAHCEVEA